MLTAIVLTMLLAPSWFTLAAMSQTRTGNLNGQVSIHKERAEIRPKSAGELKILLPAEAFNEVRRLQISGPIDDADLKFLKALANRGSVKNAKGKTVQTYLDLDLRHARIVKSDRYGRGMPLEELPSSTFSSWNGLRSMVMPLHVRVIGNYCFSSCSKLEMVEMPPKLMAIGENAFRNCSRLEEARIPSGVTEIGRGCFYGCRDWSRLFLRLQRFGRRRPAPAIGGDSQRGLRRYRPHANRHPRRCRANRCARFCQYEAPRTVYSRQRGEDDCHRL